MCVAKKEEENECVTMVIFEPYYFLFERYVFLLLIKTINIF